MKTILKATAAAILISAAVSAQADSHFSYGRPVMQPTYATQHPIAGLRDINSRQEEQRTRIERGFHRGAITRWEFRRLMAEQQDIAALERTFVADGFLAPHERAELHRRLNIASSHIVFNARDTQRRF